MLKFISIGSGSSGNCYYLQTANDAMLIDAGVGIRTMKKHLHDYGLSIDSVNHILITHDHADHIKSVGVVSTEFGIPVYATREVHVGIQRNYCVPKKVPSDKCCIIEKDCDMQAVNKNLFLPRSSQTVFCFIKYEMPITRKLQQVDRIRNTETSYSPLATSIY